MFMLLGTLQISNLKFFEMYSGKQPSTFKDLQNLQRLICFKCPK